MDNHEKQKSSPNDGWPPWFQAMFSTLPNQSHPPSSGQPPEKNSQTSSSSAFELPVTLPAPVSSNSVASNSVVPQKESNSRCDAAVSVTSESEIHGNESSISFWMWQAYQAYAKLQFSLWKVNEIYQSNQAKTNSEEQSSLPALMGSLPFDMESLMALFKNTQALSGTNDANASTSSTSVTHQENVKDQPSEVTSKENDTQEISSSSTTNKKEDEMEIKGRESDDMEMSDDEAPLAPMGTTSDSQNPNDPATSMPSIPSSNNLQHSQGVTQEYSYMNQPVDSVFNGSTDVMVSSITPYSSESTPSWNTAVDSYLQASVPQAYGVQYHQHMQPTISSHGAQLSSAAVLQPATTWPQNVQYQGSYPQQWGMPHTNQPPSITIPQMSAYSGYDANHQQSVFVQPHPMQLHQNYSSVPPTDTINTSCQSGLPSQTMTSQSFTFASPSLPQPVMPTDQPLSTTDAATVQPQPAASQYSVSYDQTQTEPAVSQASSQNSTSKFPPQNGSLSAQASSTDSASSNREKSKSSGREVDRTYSYMRGRANDTTTSMPSRNLSEKFTASDNSRKQQRSSGWNAPETFSKPPKSVRWTHSEEFFRKDPKVRPTIVKVVLALYG